MERQFGAIDLKQEEERLKDVCSVPFLSSVLWNPLCIQKEKQLQMQLEEIKKEVDDAMELTDQYLKTEDVLDYIEQRSWELRNEFLLEMDLTGEEIQTLETKIYRTQKHLEMLKTANPLCDAFSINVERRTING